MKKILMTIAVALCCVVFTGCNKDKDQTYTYSIGFDLEDSWGETSEVNQWLDAISDAYESALGVSESTFTKTGKEADCDQAVKDACKKAEPTVDNIQHLGSGTISVTNETTNKEVYTYHVTRTSNK